MEERLAQGEMMNLRVKLGSEVTTDPTYVQRVKISRRLLLSRVSYQIRTGIRAPRSRFTHVLSICGPCLILRYIFGVICHCG